MATRFNVEIVSTGEISEPVISGDRQGSLVRLGKLLAKLASGNQQGTTVNVRNGGVRASATATCAAVANADTVSVGGIALTATQHNATGTFTLVSAIATDTVTINGVVFTAFNAAVVLGAATFDIRTSNTAAATSLAAQVNAYAPFAGVLTATSALGVVTIRAYTGGTAGNSITITSQDATITASAATLANGATVANAQFDFTGSNTETAVALAAAINACTTTGLSGAVTASSSAAVVTVTAIQPGKMGNAIAFISSNGTRLAVTGSGRLASGAETLVSLSF